MLACLFIPTKARSCPGIFFMELSYCALLEFKLRLLLSNEASILRILAWMPARVTCICSLMDSKIGLLGWVVANRLIFFNCSSLNCVIWPNSTGSSIPMVLGTFSWGVSVST
ncbi:hypothetical protein D9M68_612350 [compost metagenome]